MKKSYFLVLIFSITARAENSDFKLLPTDTPKTFLLREALDKALQNNLELKKAQQHVKLAQSKSLGSLSELLPKAFLRSSTGHVIRGPKNNPIESPLLEVAVEAPLFDGKKLIALKASKDAVSADELSYSHQRDALLFEVGKLYAQALLAQSVRDVALKEVAQYEKQLLVFKNKTGLGLLRKLDEFRAEYLLKNAESLLATKELDWQNKLAALGFAINESTYFLLAPFVIESNFFAMEPVNLSQMANDSAHMKALKQKVSSANYFLVSEKFSFLPTVKLGFESGVSLFEKYEGSAFGRDFLSKIMLTVELPLFLGGSRFASYKNALATKTLAEIEFLESTQKISLKVLGLTEAIQTHSKAVASAESANLSAQKASDSAARLFLQGEATGLEVVEANVNLVAAHNSLVAAIYQLELSKLNLLFIIGKISSIISHDNDL